MVRERMTQQLENSHAEYPERPKQCEVEQRIEIADLRPYQFLIPPGCAHPWWLHRHVYWAFSLCLLHFVYHCLVDAHVTRYRFVVRKQYQLMADPCAGVSRFVAEQLPMNGYYDIGD